MDPDCRLIANEIAGHAGVGKDLLSIPRNSRITISAGGYRNSACGSREHAVPLAGRWRSRRTAGDLRSRRPPGLPKMAREKSHVAIGTCGLSMLPNFSRSGMMVRPLLYKPAR